MNLSPTDMERCAQIADRRAKRRISEIVHAVSDATSIPGADIYGRRRFPQMAQARQLVYFLARESGCTVLEICRAMARDETSVRHGIKAEKKRRGKA